MGAPDPSNGACVSCDVLPMSYSLRFVHVGIRESDGLSNMGFQGTHWPDGLNDEEALQRLQTLCLGACDGIQDLSDDARYKALRRALLNRGDLRPLAPAFLAAQPSLEAFVRHVRETRDRTQRREMVLEEFKPLWDRIRGSGAVSSAAWTGRPSLKEQAAVVQALGPVALEAVQRLIDDEERARDNGGPVDADRTIALQQLKALHQALADLIASVEHGRPLDRARPAAGDQAGGQGGDRQRGGGAAGDDVRPARIRKRRRRRRVLRRQRRRVGRRRGAGREYAEGRHAQERFCREPTQLKSNGWIDPRPFATSTVSPAPAIGSGGRPV
jgi:hypothetical protein